MIRIVIAAASDVARAGLASLARGLDGIDVVGQAADADQLSLVARSAAPDVVWIDGGSSEDSLSLFLGVVVDAPRGPGLLVFSDHPPDVNAGEYRRTEAYALLPRRAVAREVDAATRAVAAGLIVTHPDLAERTTQPSAVRSADNSSVLTPREVEVLGMLAAGLPNKTIARRLGVSAHTVKFHVGSIMTKLHASSRTEAVTDGIRRGLIFL